MLNARSRFQPGEGPSRGLLRDYEPSDGTFSSTNSHLHHRHPAGRKGPNTDSPEIWRIDKNISTFNQIQQQLV